ncbi:DUF4422 domain-containing protein [Klebsiella sp. RHBSTW-00484]|uniref:DUF4422 domain-containing protein n=1 Tax=unclassified Klebsiella TaxID=2608929 RepID=UPI0015E58704|nr:MULTISPECIES: DUF4422 domain-containing protein [unclassified Klebsiella]QLO36245.1 DUF4422 domain-containing protein [Klebsiella sp. RHBSTW-00484]QLT75762.1 DUF4422 domain-containing protein [Klebsiella sp. RHBSTW-00464]
MERMRIYTVTHKNFQPTAESIYQPIIVGNGEVNLSSAVRDNIGDNITEKNKSFCEMTALYWIWKNTSFSENDIIGLTHYRRYFKKGVKNIIATEGDIKKILNSYDIIIPKKRNYYIVSVQEHYKKAHYSKDLMLVREIISNKQSEYLVHFDNIMNGKTLSLYNMFVTSWGIFESYCNWVFPILFELDTRIDKEKYDSYQMRVIGFLAERLFNVWLEGEKNKLKIYEMPVYNTDGENLIVKGINLIKRQYCS